MNNLLSAEFSRLWKNILFKLILLLSGLFGAFMVVNQWRDIKEYGLDGSVDALIFTGGFSIIFVLAVFVGFFVGTEYSDGTLRNKLASGHTRTGIYLSKLIVCTTADILIYLVYILVVLLLGTALIGGISMPVGQLMAFTAFSLIVTFTLTSLLLLFSMNIRSKAAGAVVCFIATMLLLFSSMQILQKLSAPEFYSGYVMNEETGELKESEPVKNPRYLTGTKRKVYEFLNDVHPLCQLYRLTETSEEAPLRGLLPLTLYDGLIILAAVSGGMALFSKKNLN